MILWLAGIGALGVATAAPGARVICDFEGEAPLKGWTLPGRARSDWAKEDQTGLEVTGAWASRGERSVRLTFEAFERGEQPWRVIELNFVALGVVDFRGYDVLAFDAHNPSDAPVRVQLTGGPKGAKFFGHHFRKGGWQFTIRLDHVPPADLEQMKRLQFIVREPPERAAPCLDNFRLIDDKRERIEGLASKLTAASKAISALAGSKDLTPHESAIVSLGAEVAALRDRIAGADSPADRHASGQALVTLEKRVKERLETAAYEVAGTMADSYTQLAAAPVPRDTSRRRLDEAVELPGRHRVRALEKLIANAGDHLARARLEAEIQRHFADDDFAIGIPAAPRTLADRPQNYDGPLGRSVRIFAARHETEPFQLILIPRGKALRNLRLRASPLKGPGTIGAEHIEIAPMGWRLFPDGRFRADMLRPRISRFDIDADVQQAVWVNVYVPRDTPPGRYSGTVTIEADNARPQQVAVDLTVWPFTLPTYPSIQSAFDGWPDRGEVSDTYARFLIAHRLNPNSIYWWGEPPALDTMRRWHEWGGSHFNLLRISRGFAGIVRDDRGQLRAAPQSRDKFFAMLDPRMKEIREAGFLDQCMLYGFDELDTAQVPAMNALYGAFKERYGPIKTMAAINLPVWKEFPRIEHLDIWCVQPSGFELTDQVRDRIKSRGKQLWWYNLMADQLDLARSRAQFWATFRDGFDGVLHYSLSRGGWYDPAGPGLYPQQSPEKPHAYGGILRRDHEGLPVATVTLESWREGLEDCDYLMLLRDARERLSAKVATDDLDRLHLIHRADRMLDVPETITRGLIAMYGMRAAGSAFEPRPFATDDLRIILEARHEIAQLIVEISNSLE